MYRVIKSDSVVPGLALVMGGNVLPGARGPQKGAPGELSGGLSALGRQQPSDQGQEDAELLLREATAQAEDIRRQAREAGWQEGHLAGRQAGLDAGAAEVRAQIERAKAIADEAARSRQAILEASESDLVALALEVARTVIGAEIAQNQESVRLVMERAVAHVKGSGPMRLRVNPGDADLVKRHWPASQSEAKGRQWEVVGDDKVSPGGCLIDTPSGHVDARVETQLARIQEAFVQLAEPTTVVE